MQKWHVSLHLELMGSLELPIYLHGHVHGLDGGITVEVLAKVIHWMTISSFLLPHAVVGTYS